MNLTYPAFMTSDLRPPTSDRRKSEVGGRKRQFICRVWGFRLTGSRGNVNGH